MWKNLLPREIRAVEMVVVGVLIEDVDDAEALRAQRLSLLVHSSFELGLNPYINDLSMQVFGYILNLLALQRNGAVALFPKFLGYQKVRVVFYQTHEVPAVLIDQRKPALLEIRLIKQHQPILEPRAGIEPIAVMSFLVGDAELLDYLVSDVVEQVDLLRSILLPLSEVETHQRGTRVAEK